MKCQRRRWSQPYYLPAGVVDHYVVLISIFSGDRCWLLQHSGTKYLKGGKKITSPAKKTRITCFIFKERALILNTHKNRNIYPPNASQRCVSYVCDTVLSKHYAGTSEVWRSTLYSHSYIHIFHGLSWLWQQDVNKTLTHYHLADSSLPVLYWKSAVRCFLSEVRRSNPGQFLWFQ